MRSGTSFVMPRGNGRLVTIPPSVLTPAYRVRHVALSSRCFSTDFTVHRHFCGLLGTAATIGTPNEYEQADFLGLTRPVANALSPSVDVRRRRSSRGVSCASRLRAVHKDGREACGVVSGIGNRQRRACPGTQLFGLAPGSILGRWGGLGLDGYASWTCPLEHDFGAAHTGSFDHDRWASLGSH